MRFDNRLDAEIVASALELALCGLKTVPSFICAHGSDGINRLDELFLEARRQTMELVPNKRSIVTVTGPSLSGKTTLVRKLIATGYFREVISHTTRPKRSGEFDGLDYHFVSDAEFRNTEMAEFVEFSGYKYGIAVRTLETAMKAGQVPLVILTPGGVKMLEAEPLLHDVNVVRVFIGVDSNTQMQRAFNRAKDDPSMTPQAFAKRALEFSKEQEWAKQGVWNIFISAFDDKNERSWVDAICQEIGIVSSPSASMSRYPAEVSTGAVATM